MMKHTETFRDLKVPWTETATGSYKPGSLGENMKNYSPPRNLNYSKHE